MPSHHVPIEKEIARAREEKNYIIPKRVIGAQLL